MKKWTRNLIALVMVVTLVGCGSALAAEAAETAPAEPVVAVQLDGQNLTFTDAVPQVKDQRTFLPFRAVFEAMGAKVDNEGMTITAKRGDKTLIMTIGSTEAVVTENGVETPITMDVAPYVDNTTWRTYVPVRFAAQAFGCSVGWDQDDYTAIIIDTEKLLTEIMQDKTFTYMEKYLTYSAKYQTGLWDTDLVFEGGMNLMGAPLTFAGTAVGTTEGSEKMDMDMTMTMDMSGFIAYLEEMSKDLAGEAGEEAVSVMTPEEQAMLDALATDGIGLKMRTDLSKGLIYMTLTGELLERAGMTPNTWYSMDMAAMYAQLGLNWEDFMSTSRTLDYKALIKTILQSAQLTSITDYAELKAAGEAVAAFFADQSFAVENNIATNVLSLEEEGLTLGVIFSLALDSKKKNVTAYELTFSLRAGAAESGVVAMEMVTWMDEKDQMYAEVIVDLAGILAMDMAMEGGYAPGKTAPVTEPPAGAVILPYEQLLAPVA